MCSRVIAREKQNGSLTVRRGATHVTPPVSTDSLWPQELRHAARLRMIHVLVSRRVLAAVAVMAAAVFGLLPPAKWLLAG